MDASVLMHCTPRSVCHNTWVAQVARCVRRPNAAPGELKRFELALWDGVHDLCPAHVDGAHHVGLGLADGVAFQALQASKATFFPG